MKALTYLSRLAPAVGILANAIRFRGLHCGLNVEILGFVHLIYGRHVSLGEGTRIEFPRDSAVELGEHVSISRSVHIVPDAGRRIAIGDGATVQDDCRIYGDVEIGRQCIFAPNIFVSSGSHAFNTIPYRPIQEQDQLSPIAGKPIKICSDCWIGINAVILPGISIGRGSVIGANSVVNEDIAPYSVAVGSPARVIAQRLAFAPKSRIVASDERDWPYFYEGFRLSLAEGETGFVAHTHFTLAMQHPHPRAIRLSLSGEKGEISFTGERRPLPQRADIVEFKYAGDSNSSPFLRFEVDGSCQLFGAEIV